VPISIDNDANAGAFGEWYIGAGQKCDSLLYITVSTRIGGGWFINGKPFRGFNSLAGEIGHIIVDPSGPMCACGKSGCLEALASGPAIASKTITRLLVEKESGNILRQLCSNNLELIIAKMVNQAAGKGDDLAIEIIKEAARYLGVGIGQAVTLLNPERVVIGGGVAKAGKLFWSEVRRAARDYLLPDVS
jgi:glucokinase